MRVVCLRYAGCCLVDDDLGTVDAGNPGDLDIVTDRDDLTTEDLTGGDRTRELAVGTGLDGGVAANVDLESTEVVVTEVALGPRRGAFGGRGNRGKDVGLLGPRGPRGRGRHVEDKLTLLGGVLRGDLERDQSGGVAAVIPRVAGDGNLVDIVVDGAVVTVVG